MIYIWFIYDLFMIYLPLLSTNDHVFHGLMFFTSTGAAEGDIIDFFVMRNELCLDVTWRSKSEMKGMRTLHQVGMHGLENIRSNCAQQTLSITQFIASAQQKNPTTRTANLPETMFALPRTWPVSKPQMVQVVSMEEVPRIFGSTSFQSKEVKGAQKSEFLLLFRRHSSLGKKTGEKGEREDQTPENWDERERLSACDYKS